jgi:hypothetical protein
MSFCYYFSYFQWEPPIREAVYGTIFQREDDFGCRLAAALDFDWLDSLILAQQWC